MESVDTREQHGLSPETSVVKVRCPQCFKLYAVDGAEITEAKPQFACSKCETRFWFPFPESLGANEIMGFPVAWLEAPAGETESATALAPSVPAEPKVERHFNCPRCQARYSAGDPECPKCGVVFAKLDFIEIDRTVAVSPQLRRLWHQVMENYGAKPVHRKFVHAAQREKNLLYASQQYQRVLKAHSGDETALQMQKEITALTVATEGMAKPMKSFRARDLMPRLTTLLMVIGGVIIGLGFIIPASRNLIGLGVAMVFFMLAIEWFFNNQSN